MHVCTISMMLIIVGYGVGSWGFHSCRLWGMKNYYIYNACCRRRFDQVSITPCNAQFAVGSWLKVTTATAYCCDYHIWIVNTRFFQSPTTARMTSSVVVKQIALFTMLQPLLQIHEEWKRRVALIQSDLWVALCVTDGAIPPFLRIYL